MSWLRPVMWARTPDLFRAVPRGTFPPTQFGYSTAQAVTPGLAAREAGARSGVRIEWCYTLDDSGQQADRVPRGTLMSGAQLGLHHRTGSPELAIHSTVT
jgi:hypothetical protein